MVPDYLDTLPISHVTVWHFNRKNGTKLCKYLKQKIFKKSLCWSLSALIVWPKKINVRLSEPIRFNLKQNDTLCSVRLKGKPCRIAYRILHSLLHPSSCSSIWDFIGKKDFFPVDALGGGEEGRPFLKKSI